LSDLKSRRAEKLQDKVREGGVQSRIFARELFDGEAEVVVADALARVEELRPGPGA
jgi:hypothetical protein